MTKVFVAVVLSVAVAGISNAQECRVANKDLALEIAKRIELLGRCETFCHGCGCKGGPGYSNPKTGQCVSWQELNETCGPPPHERCKKDCEPVNSSCAAWGKTVDDTIAEYSKENR